MWFIFLGGNTSPKCEEVRIAMEGPQLRQIQVSQCNKNSRIIESTEQSSRVKRKCFFFLPVCIECPSQLDIVATRTTKPSAVYNVIWQLEFLYTDSITTSNSLNVQVDHFMLQPPFHAPSFWSLLWQCLVLWLPHI